MSSPSGMRRSTGSMRPAGVAGRASPDRCCTGEPCPRGRRVGAAAPQRRCAGGWRGGVGPPTSSSDRAWVRPARSSNPRQRCDDSSCDGAESGVAHPAVPAATSGDGPRSCAVVTGLSNAGPACVGPCLRTTSPPGSSSVVVPCRPIASASAASASTARVTLPCPGPAATSVADVTSRPPRAG
ncbi:Zinc finger protein ZFPM1 [Kineococcus radiotolerans SRS30216 = ATCC BAA-149]|uniref:Zinc finger protein ZFPM1 n=1 Tax=Kineococcus radiotolerans (strain ATCC BAA-149 / DSM 14245 / SRS30216) TaxID=266940 RepID=A6WA12_KINRD|nr:Zinc finger protein ZFPM1 [Kineococcus radiotolerans SRS30216 = ATCC BAA-149]